MRGRSALPLPAIDEGEAARQVCEEVSTRMKIMARLVRSSGCFRARRLLDSGLPDPDASNLATGASALEAAQGIVVLSGGDLAGWEIRLDTAMSHAPISLFVFDAVVIAAEPAAAAHIICPECNGTREYRGLVTVEPCRACCGG
jgi:hypothetical protein